MGCGIVGLLGAAASDHGGHAFAAEHAVERVKSAPKSLSFCRVAGLVPTFCDRGVGDHLVVAAPGWGCASAEAGLSSVAAHAIAAMKTVPIEPPDSMVPLTLRPVNNSAWLSKPHQSHLSHDAPRQMRQSWDNSSCEPRSIVRP